MRKYTKYNASGSKWLKIAGLCHLYKFILNVESVVLEQLGYPVIILPV